jgi:hypothetical protein
MQDLAQHSHFQDHVVHKGSHQKHMRRKEEQAPVERQAEAEEAGSPAVHTERPRVQVLLLLRQAPGQDMVGGRNLEVVGTGLFEDRTLAESHKGHCREVVALEHIVHQGCSCPHTDRDRILLPVGLGSVSRAHST